MLYDLNIPWSSSDSQDGSSNPDIQRTISFLSELNYSVLAMNHTISSAIPSQIVNPIPLPLTFPTPENTTILRRCTLIISDPTLNHRLPALAAAYDIFALRPTTEKAFLAACTSLSEHSLISLDLSMRFPFHFRPKPLMTAINRGIKFEICYAQATAAESSGRRNFITNVLAIVRATSGRGLVVSSGAKSVLAVRAPADVGNLMCIWGVGTERAREAVTVQPRSVVVNEGIKRTGYRGIIDVVEGGEKPVLPQGGAGKKAKNGGAPQVTGAAQKGKRKIEDREQDPAITPQMSKRQAKKLRLEALRGESGSTLPTEGGSPAAESGSNGEQADEISESNEVVKKQKPNAGNAASSLAAAKIPIDTPSTTKGKQKSNG